MNLSTKIAAAKAVVTSKAGQQLLLAQKNSPALLFGAGVVGVVATVVLASKATLTLDPILDEFELQKAERKEAKELGHYPNDHYKQDMALLHTKLVLDVAKTYGPAIIVGSASIAALGGSHYVLSKRNASLMAAYTTVDKAFKAYRKRVVDELGDEKDRQFMFGSEEKEIFVGETKKGEPKIERVQRAGGPSMYAVFFQKGNPNWNPEPSYNFMFLKAQERYLNDQLVSKGVVLLNDVYDCLGVDRTTAGAVVGWVKGNPNGNGYIDFGIWDEKDMDRFHQFMTGAEESILLDFNVDGMVYEALDEIRASKNSLSSRLSRKVGNRA